MSSIFAAQVIYGVGTYPYGVAVADVNGDNKPDIVSANGGSGGSGTTVSILINQGTFTPPFAQAFAPQVTHRVGTNPAGVAIADVNGDNKPDIVCTNYYSNTVSVLINQGTFTSPFMPAFASQMIYSVGGNPWGIAIADVNGDSKVDVACVNFNSATVSVLINQGTFSSPFTLNFTSQVTYSVGSQPVDVAIADVNGDGKPDIVSTGNGGAGTTSILINQGTFAPPFKPAFAAQVTYSVGSFPQGVAVADVNGDDKPDIVSANSGSTAISLLINQGTFVPPFTLNFASHVASSVGSVPKGVIAADVNSDGKRDLVIGNYMAAGTLSALINQGDFVPPFTLNFASRVTSNVDNNPAGIAIADVNGDGKQDAVCANWNSATVSVLINNASFPLSFPSPVPKSVPVPTPYLKGALEPAPSVLVHELIPEPMQVPEPVHTAPELAQTTTVPESPPALAPKLASMPAPSALTPTHIQPIPTTLTTTSSLIQLSAAMPSQTPEDPQGQAPIVSPPQLIAIAPSQMHDPLPDQAFQALPAPMPIAPQDNDSGPILSTGASIGIGVSAAVALAAVVVTGLTIYAKNSGIWCFSHDSPHLNTIAFAGVTTDLTHSLPST